MQLRHRRGLLAALLVTFAYGCTAAQAQDPLPSWNDGPTKSAIVEFVTAVTDENGNDYVEPAERIAVFDHDGTLWVEYPLYTQILFAFDRVKALAPQHPEWKTTQPFKALLEGDMETVGASGAKGVMEILVATHTGMTAEEFEQEASNWLATTKHPKFDRLYSESIYQPQLELLAYLRAKGFKTFIVSGGQRRQAGIAFMRPITEKNYGIRIHRRSRSLARAWSPSSRLKTVSRCSFANRRSTSSTTRRASRSASINTSAAGRSWPLAERTAACPMPTCMD